MINSKWCDDHMNTTAHIAELEAQLFDANTWLARSHKKLEEIREARKLLSLECADELLAKNDSSDWKAYAHILGRLRDRIDVVLDDNKEGEGVMETCPKCGAEASIGGGYFKCDSSGAHPETKFNQSHKCHIEELEAERDESERDRQDASYALANLQKYADSQKAEWVLRAKSLHETIDTIIEEREELQSRLAAVRNRLREDGDGSGAYSELHWDLFKIISLHRPLTKSEKNANRL